MGLTPIARQAATLDAAGFSHAQIVRVLGVGETSVSRWRKDPEYRNLRDEISDRQGEEISPLIDRVRAEIMEVVPSAMEAIREGLAAETEDGKPHLQYRLQAAAALPQYLKLVVPATDATGGKGASATAVIQVNVPDADVLDGEGREVQAEPEQLDR